MQELTTTKERILEASKCETVQEALKKLWPDVFEKEMKKIEPFDVNTSGREMIFIARCFAPTHDLADKCFGLSDNFNWELKPGIGNIICLIPTPKP